MGWYVGARVCAVCRGCGAERACCEGGEWVREGGGDMERKEGKKEGDV